VRGFLTKAHKVIIDSRSTRIGGSWQGKWLPGRACAWEPAILESFHDKASEYKRPVVLDVGANTGSFCLLAKFHAGMTVHAFEPSPLPLEILRRNVELNGLADRVTIHPFALSDSVGTATLKVPCRADGTYFESGMATLGKPGRFSEWEEVEVKTRRLDDLGLGKIHILKVDAEGCELYVLRGGENLIRAHMPRVLVESNEANFRQFGYAARDVFGLLKSWGYSRFSPVGRRDMWCET